ncbi:hypothetical protein DKX38_029251 [Salix brachista]|uniref:DRBM domain-containing protein n=1 Tax=Salix brachista TaxID=2182728 RepID=A0A5N5J4H0_9ROSI|nr:hypothetical protein DKX38_029251 [Salix brachista]
MSKSKLQVLCQQKGWELPTYQVTKQGHDHSPLFYATVTVNASSFSTSSSSSSSKKAQSDAAELALNHFSLPAPSLSAGCSSGSAGVNTRLSTGGTLQLNQQDAKPTHLSNEAVAASKNDESLEGYCFLLLMDLALLLFDVYLRSRLLLSIHTCGEWTLPHAKISTNRATGSTQNLFKNQLRTYAQKRNFTLPEYSCEREGPPHAPLFKCRVTVNGQTYESREHFPTLNRAEQAAAKAALSSLLPNGVEEDESFYKNRLQDLAQRECYGSPTYSTEKSGEAHALTFVSTVKVKGEFFTGQGAKTKKEAEMSAAKIAYTALKQRCQAQEAVGETQLSASSVRAGLTAFFQQNTQPKLPVPNEQAEQYRGSKSGIEFMVGRNKILVHPRGTKMTYPPGSTVLPVSDDKWTAVKMPP